MNFRINVSVFFLELHGSQEKIGYELMYVVRVIEPPGLLINFKNIF